MKNSRVKVEPQDELFEMANLFSKHTGLPFVVWISSGGGRARHDIRVKVANGRKVLPSEMISAALRPTFRVAEGEMSESDLGLSKKWSDLNYDVLVRYWDEAIDTKEAVDAIRPIQS